jgi:hypothetical protein
MRKTKALLPVSVTKKKQPSKLFSIPVIDMQMQLIYELLFMYAVF